MKKALFNFYREQPAWCDGLAQGRPLYMFPVANRPLVDYILDACACANVSEVLIVYSDYDGESVERIGDGRSRDIKIFHHGAKTSADFRPLLTHNSKFFEDADEILVFNGVLFPRPSAAGMSIEPEDTETENLSEVGIYVIRGGKSFRARGDYQGEEVDTLEDFFRLNMSMFEEFETGRYTLSGYMVENNVITGMNDEIQPGCEVLPPVIIGDNVQLCRGTRIGPYAVIGDGAIVDHGTSVRRSVVLSDTYLSTDLEFEKKLVRHWRIADPDSGALVDLSDDNLSMARRPRSFKKFLLLPWRLGAALLLVAIQLPLFGIFLLLGLRKVGVSGCWRSDLRSWILYPVFSVPHGRKRTIYFKKLSLDLLPLLIKVLYGALLLSGDSMYDRSISAARIAEGYRRYQPGVFSAASANAAGHNDLARGVIEDLYFRAHFSYFGSIAIVIKSLVTRLFTDEKHLG
ncbi:MAG: hypothetical protein PHS41_03220 [Victivallaceae bacterium]|nr:hypothetical protein [Victivallaceae bacterium]